MTAQVAFWMAVRDQLVEQLAAQVRFELARAQVIIECGHKPKSVIALAIAAEKALDQIELMNLVWQDVEAGLVPGSA